MYVEDKKIIQVGNSLGITFKKYGNMTFGLEKDQPVKVEYHNNKIVIKKVDIKKDGADNE